MGKNARVRKASKISDKMREKEIIKTRKREKAKPVMIKTTQFLLTLMVSIALMAVGFKITHRLEQSSIASQNTVEVSK